MSPSESVAPLPALSRRPRRLRWAIAAIAVALAALYYRGWATEPLTLADGRSFDVLNFDRHVSYTLNRDGSRDTERLFWVRYYANARGADATLAEARHLAPALFPIAERLGYRTLKLEPARPLLLRHFPLVVYAYTLRFTRDSAGTWREVGAS